MKSKCGESKTLKYVTETSEEEIAMCLNCTRPECVNCLSSPGRATVKADARVHYAEQVRELYDQGYDDIVIAGKIGKSRGFVGKLRREMNLPTHRVHIQGREEEIGAGIRELNAKGKNDAEIARALNIPYHHINKLRREMRLAKN